MSQASPDTPTGLDLLDRFGFCILPEVIPPQRVAEVRHEVLAVVAAHRHKSAPPQIGFVPGLINYSRCFAPYLTDPRLTSLLANSLGAHLRVSFTSAIVNEPGNQRGGWHADWPFNQTNAGHIPAPYPDLRMHVTTLWMLSTFSADNGGTLVVPASHRRTSNPTADTTCDPRQPLADESQVTGEAGSVLVMDSRLWHATAPNQTQEPRVALAIRYAPWWLNLEVLRPDSAERHRMCRESGQDDNRVPSVPDDVYAQLPDDVRPLFQHWRETSR
ncbi:MAG: phytanoyl-CoA dioxygenase family protein [Planctomycetota bacterium]|nr:phytanoyl-CoA dioxygenase family protein [Planctomycetota bacterium]